MRPLIPPNFFGVGVSGSILEGFIICSVKSNTILIIFQVPFCLHAVVVFNSLQVNLISTRYFIVQKPMAGQLVTEALFPFITKGHWTLSHFTATILGYRILSDRQISSYLDFG